MTWKTRIPGLLRGREKKDAREWSEHNTKTADRQAVVQKTLGRERGVEGHPKKVAVNGGSWREKEGHG